VPKAERERPRKRPDERLASMNNLVETGLSVETGLPVEAGRLEEAALQASEGVVDLLVEGGLSELAE
jgi:hypothetical protein